MLMPRLKTAQTYPGEGRMADTIEQSTARKVYWRLLPLAILTYFLCYLDRINVGFAALTMNKDLGHYAATYGMAAGHLSWGRFLFLRPSARRLLLGLFPVRSAEQPHSGKGRRPDPDRTHHDQLGPAFGRHGVR